MPAGETFDRDGARSIGREPERPLSSTRFRPPGFVLATIADIASARVHYAHAMRALVIEDDLLLRRNVAEMLHVHRGFVVETARDGREGLVLAISGSFDVIVLDLNLPELDGIEVLRRLRDASVPTPVLVLTARDTTEDIVRTLESGGDDHLVKPFSMDELIARVGALVRRSLGAPSPVIRFRGFELDATARRVSRDDRTVDLTALEYRLLEHLVTRRGRIRSKVDLIDALWDRSDAPSENAVEVTVSSLRRRLGQDVIRTVRNLGYVVDAEGDR